MSEELEPDEPSPEVPLEREDPDDPDASLDPESDLPRPLEVPDDFEEELLLELDDPL